MYIRYYTRRKNIILLLCLNIDRKREENKKVHIIKRQNFIKKRGRERVCTEDVVLRL